MPKNAEELLVSKMDQVLRLLAVMATKDMKQREQIALLDRAGFPPKDIAMFLGTTGNNVRVALTGLRKARKSTRVPKNKED